MRLYLITLVILHLPASPSLEQGNEFRSQCASVDSAESIKACSTLITSGQLSNKALPVAYLDRASAYARQGQYDHALQDYDTALRLDATYANAFYGRGWVYAKKTEYDHAIQEFNRALDLNPRLPGAVRERGNAYSAAKVEFGNSGLLIPIVAGGALAAYSPKASLAVGSLTLGSAAIFKKGWAWWLVGCVILLVALFFYWKDQQDSKTNSKERA